MFTSHSFSRWWLMVLFCNLYHSICNWSILSTAGKRKQCRLGTFAGWSSFSSSDKRRNCRLLCRYHHPQKFSVKKHLCILKYSLKTDFHSSFLLSGRGSKIFWIYVGQTGPPIAPAQQVATLWCSRLLKSMEKIHPSLEVYLVSWKHNWLMKDEDV